MRSNQVTRQDNDDIDTQAADYNHKRLFSRENFAFDDDVWDLTFRSTIASRRRSRVVFTSFPDSVKNDVKQYVIDGILGAKLSNQWARATTVTLKKAFQLLAEKHNTHFSPLALTQDDACSIEEYFCQEGHVDARAHIAVVARFATFLREKHQGLPTDFRPNPLAAPSSKNRGRSYSEGLVLQ